MWSVSLAVDMLPNLEETVERMQKVLMVVANYPNAGLENEAENEY